MWKKNVKKTMKKVQVQGKHVKKVTSGGWTSENKLALCSEDRQLRILDVQLRLLEPLARLSPDPRG